MLSNVPSRFLRCFNLISCVEDKMVTSLESGLQPQWSSQIVAL
jgi:hypothetical protein